MSVEPSVKLPLIVGGLVLAGMTAGEAAIAAVTGEAELAEPPGLTDVTTTRTV